VIRQFYVKNVKDWEPHFNQNIACFSNDREGIPGFYRGMYVRSTLESGLMFIVQEALP